MFLDGLARFGRMIGIGEDKAEEALHNERGAKLVLSRREMLVGSAALVATAAAFSFPRRLPQPVRSDTLNVSLHTGEPNQWNEVSYEGYARAELERNEKNWNVKSGTAKNAQAIVFPECSGGAEVVTHFQLAIGRRVILTERITTPISIGSGVTPRFSPGGLVMTFDGLSSKPARRAYDVKVASLVV